MGKKALQKTFATSIFSVKDVLQSFLSHGKKALQKINLTEKIDVAKEISSL